MRQKVEDNLGGIGATLVALVFVVVYSLWGAFMLHNERAELVGAPAQAVALK